MSENGQLLGTLMVSVARKSSPTMTLQNHKYNEPQAKLTGWFRYLPPRFELATTDGGVVFSYPSTQRWTKYCLRRHAGAPT